MDREKLVREQVLSRAREVLADGKRRTGQQIAFALSNKGLRASKSLVNSVLFREGRPYVQYDRATFTYSLKASVVNPRRNGDETPPEVDHTVSEVSNSRQTDDQPDFPAPSAFLSDEDAKAQIVAFLAKHGPATINQVIAGLKQQDLRFTGLDLWRLMKQLREEGYVSDPGVHESSTVTQPVFVYQLAQPDLIGLPAPEEAPTETQQARIDFKQAVISILRDSGPITFDDLFAQLQQTGATSDSRTEIVETLKGLYQEDILAEPEGRRVTAEARPVYYFRLQQEKPTTLESRPAEPEPVTLDAAIVAVLEEFSTATITEMRSELNRKFGINVERLTIHEALKQLRKQGVVAEPEEHPTHTVLAPRYIYRLKSKTVAPWPSIVIETPTGSEADTIPNDVPVVPVQLSIPGADLPAIKPAPKTRRALLQEILAEIGRPTHYSILHEKANARLPQDDDFSKAAVYSTMAYSDVFRSHGDGFFGLAEWSNVPGIDSGSEILRYCPMPLLPVKPYPAAFFDSVVHGRDILARQSLTVMEFWRHMQTWARRTNSTKAAEAQEAFNAWYAAGLIQHIQFRRHSNTTLTLTLPITLPLEETRAHCLTALCQRVQQMPELLWSLARLAHPTVPSISTLIFGDEKDGFDLSQRLTILGSLGAVHKVKEEWRLTRTGHAALEATPPQQLPDLRRLESAETEATASQLRWDDERLGLLDLDGWD